MPWLVSKLQSVFARKRLKWAALAIFVGGYLASAYVYEKHRQESVFILKQQLANHIRELRWRNNDPGFFPSSIEIMQLERDLKSAEVFSEREIFTRRLNMDR